MKAVQLVTPNLNVTYRGGWCQKANENTVGEDGVYASAYEAWVANEQHTGKPPKGVYVPIYLNMPNGPKDDNGVQQDDVAISCPDGTVAAAALAGTHKGLFKYPSLQAYKDDYAKNNGGATYRGYGTYIGKVQVIKEEDVITRGRAIRLLRLARRGVTEPKIAALMKLNEDEWLDSVYQASWFKEQTNRIQSAASKTLDAIKKLIG